MIGHLLHSNRKQSPLPYTEFKARVVAYRHSMKIFLRLLSFHSSFRWQITLAILLGCVMLASNIGLLGMATYLIAIAALGPLVVVLTLPTYIVRLLGVTRAVSRYGERLQSHDVTFRLLAHLRVWVYSRLEPLAPAHLLTYRSGDILTRLVTDVEELQTIYLRVVSPIITAIIIGFLTFALFSIFRPLLAWIALAFLIIAGIGVPLLTGWLSRGLGKRQLALRTELKTQMVDGIQGIQDLLAYGRADDQRHKIAALDSELKCIQRRMAYISGLQLALNDALMNLALWFILILAIPLVTSRFIDGVYLGFLALAILASFEAIHPLAQTFQFLGHSIAAGERLFKITDAPSIVANIASSLRHDYDFSRSRSAQGFGRMQVCHSSLRSESNSPGTEILPLRCAQGCGSRTQNDMVHLGCQTSSSRPKERAKLQASERDLSRPYEPISYEPSIPAHATLEFDQVHFAYHPHEREVLQGISFQLHPGERVAIVGPSGSGKSTVARLALRLWDPTQGIIRLNGQPHGRFALDDLRNHMGVVAQDTYLFNDTLRANLLLARPNASDDQLALALEQAQLTEFVHRLPKGLDTWIGEQGLRLSGGERQRLAIARALLKDAPMLILDEVTANLDPVTERALLDALDGLMQTRTTLLITHRLIAMERMNEILVLDQGQIIERGTHEQLLAAGNLYRHLFDTQNSIFTIGAGASVIW